LPVTLPEVTVLSKDQFCFRLALSPVLMVVDARRFVASRPAAEPHALSHFMPAGISHAALPPLIASAAIEILGTKTLGEIMADPKLVTEAVQARVAAAIPGTYVTRVLQTAINLPRETRKMFTDVERAKMEAQGTLERARGEQAALRVLTNAARLISDNPALANLRLLQAIESAKGSTTIFLGDAVASPMGFPRDRVRQRNSSRSVPLDPRSCKDVRTALLFGVVRVLLLLAMAVFSANGRCGRFAIGPLPRLRAARRFSTSAIRLAPQSWDALRLSPRASLPS